jgi:hypothetical protein
MGRANSGGSVTVMNSVTTKKRNHDKKTDYLRNIPSQSKHIMMDEIDETRQEVLLLNTVDTRPGRGSGKVVRVGQTHWHWRDNTGSTNNALKVAAVRTNSRAPTRRSPYGSRFLGVIPSQGPEGIELLLNLQQIRSSCIQPRAALCQARAFLNKLFQASGYFSLLSYAAEQQILQFVHEHLVELVFDCHRHVVDNSLW